MSNIDKETHLIFVNEVKELLSSLNSHLLILEHEPINNNAITENQRNLHTKKGKFATLEFKNVVNACHIAEDAINALKKNGYVDSDSLDIFFSLLNKLESLLTFIANIKINEFTLESNKKIETMKEFDFTALIADLESISVENLNIGSNYEIVVKFNPDCKLKSARGFQVLKSLESIAKIISSKPKLNELEEGSSFQDLKINLISNDDEKSIQQLISTISDDSDIIIERIGNKTNQINANSSMAQPASIIQSVRVQLSYLDQMMDILGELVIERNTLAQHLKLIDENQDRLFIGIDRAASDLKNLILKTRLVPLEHIYEQLPRLIREISKISNKKCELVLGGKYIEIDRGNIDLLNEVLIHLLRNAIDHGIETSDERKKKNKPEHGKIIINATIENNDVVISIEDDGVGVNIPALKQKAEQKGIINKNSQLDRDNLIALLFLSGFSTNEQITELSGRGIGLNVVYTNIVDKLKGSINVETQTDKGTRFSLRIPNSLTIFRALTVQISSMIFTIPISDIYRIYHIKDEKIFYHNNKPFVVISQETVPIVSIKERYNLDKTRSKDFQEQIVTNEAQILIICGNSTKKVGIIVDNIISTQQVVLKKADSLLSRIREYSGFTFINEDEIYPVLNPIQLLGSV